MTSTTTAGPLRRITRRAVVTLTTAALAGTGVAALSLATSAPAQAALGNVTDAAFTWAINDEVNAGAFAPGTWNLMSAGRVGNPGAGGKTLTTADSGATWSNGAAAGWKATSGNVTIEDLQPGGGYAPTTFQGTRTNSTGQATSGSSSTILAETRLALSHGTGTVDPDANTAQITWDGDATVLFYSGMTFFYISDPELVVRRDGTATLSATLAGYATSMADPDAWQALPEKKVSLADLTGVDVTPTGVTAQPAYREVAYTAPSGATTQSRSGSAWGAFPQDFVDFQQAGGQGPYWYSTGGSADVRKPARPISATWSTTSVVPSVTVSDTDVLPTGAHVVTVTGTGFDPTKAVGTRPPAAGQPAGAYVAFGRFADVWRPSATAPGTSRKTSDVKWAAPASSKIAGTVPLADDGTFSTTLVLDKAAADAAVAGAYTGRYGVYTYPGGGAVEPTFETYTPITFTEAPVAATPAAPAVPVTPSVPPTKAATSATARISKLPTATRAGKARIKVRTTGTGMGMGTATLTLRTATGKVVKKVKATSLDAAGVATLALPRLARGRYTLVAVYAGSATTAATRTKVSFTVR